MKRNDFILYLDNGSIVKDVQGPIREAFADDSCKVISVNDNSNSADLFMYYCGISACEPGYSWGPSLREHFLLHYVLEGEGILKVRNREYKLVKNQGFLLFPNELSYYKASTTNPWKYTWVGFHGLNAESYLELAGLTKQTPIFSFTRGELLKNCFFEMVKTFDEYKYGATLRLQSLLYMLFSELIENTRENIIINKNIFSRKYYIRKSIEFIQSNYMKDISISQLASHVGLNRSYLSSLFKQVLNTSPHRYLSQYRINKACELLKDKSFSIEEVANMTGYNDPVVFQKFFKNIMGISPNKYRKRIQNEP